MRLILIDNTSGFIFGDTADIPGAGSVDTISDAARLLDESIGEHGRSYYDHPRNPRTSCCGYDVYRADIDGIEAVPVVQDGQDQETIDAVISSCRYVGFVECVRDLD